MAFRTAPAGALVLLAGGATLLAALLLVAGRRAPRAERPPTSRLQLLQAIPRPVFVVQAWKPGRPNLYVNAAYSELTGYPADEALAEGFDAFAIFADPAAAAALPRELTASPRTHVAVRRRDGSTIAALLEVWPWRDGDGGPGVVGLLERDDAGAPPAERRLGGRNHAALAAAPAAGAAKLDFLSWLSHELRSPLNACVMWLDVLALAPQPDKVAKAAEAIKRNLARQTKLVNDLSDAAKISSGGLEVQLKPLDAIALLRANLDAWQLLAIGRQLAFHHDIEPAAAQVEADPERLLLALNHLIDNAVASTPAGGRVELRARVEDDLVVEVEDTGGTLSADDAAHLFEPLWRSAASTKGRAGIGLGLAIAHHIVAQHGGALTAKNGSAGALFAVRLPLAAAPAEGRISA